MVEWITLTPRNVRKRMKSGRYIGVMSGTSLDGVDVVLAAIDERMVAQQASLTWPDSISLKRGYSGICQGGN